MSIVKENQNIFDIVVENFGTLEQLFVLLDDNDLAVNAKLIGGQDLVINKVNVGDENVKNFIALQNITLNNDQGEKEPPLLGGDWNNDWNNDFN